MQYKKIIPFILTLTFITPVFATPTKSLPANQSFSDVAADSWYADAVMDTYNSGILSGVSETEFAPNNTFSIEQMIAVTARLHSIQHGIAYDFSSDNDESWDMPYLRYAKEAGFFSDDTVGINATRSVFATMLYQALPDVLEPINDIPLGYISDISSHDNSAIYSLYSAGIMSGSMVDGKNCFHPNRQLTRAEAAVIISHILHPETRVRINTDSSSRRQNRTVNKKQEASNTSITVGENVISIGMSQEMLTDELGAYTIKLQSAYPDMHWLLYGTDTYKKFLVAGVQNNTVVAIVALNDRWVSGEISAGDRQSGDKIDFNKEGLHYTIYSDLFNELRSYMLFIMDEDLYLSTKQTPCDITLFDESLLIYHLTNAMRVMHNIPILEYNHDCQTAAIVHSNDMARNNYFAHQDKNGVRVGGRVGVLGIPWVNAGENIAAGYNNAISVFAGWINSEGHRKSILNRQYEKLGVAAAYNPSSQYDYYWTQVFVSLQSS